MPESDVKGLNVFYQNLSQRARMTRPIPATSRWSGVPAAASVNRSAAGVTAVRSITYTMI